jgi:DNA polymerase-3 subunit epsilon
MGVVSRLSARPLVFVDIETNGLNHIRGRVIEVAAIRVEAGKVVRSFSSLVDPETELPHFITNLTGITTNDLKGAPTYAQIADELADILDGAVFVAHNVRFDYSFLKQEFKRVGRSFLPKQLCTVKLSRALFPEHSSHKLQSLIERYNFTYSQRHRAYDDAHVLWQFVQYVEQNVAAELVAAAVARQLRQPALPKAVPGGLIKNLPTGPGVYIFEDQQGRPLYVGKSINIKKRVLQHFSRDHDNVQEFKISQGVHHITTQETTGELAALLLESKLVKELQPLYNRQLRRTEKLMLARGSLDERGYISVQLEEASQIEPEHASDILAVYPRRGRAKDSLNEMVRTYELCPKLLGLEKGKAACFLYQLHKCRGACVGEESAEAYNARLFDVFSRQRIQAWPYQGAVLVKEVDDSLGSDHGIIVDQWCVIAELTQEPYCEPVIHSHNRVFDLDTYKILQSFMSHKLPRLKIQPLSSLELNQLGI